MKLQFTGIFNGEQLNDFGAKFIDELNNEEQKKLINLVKNNYRKTSSLVGEIVFNNLNIEYSLRKSETAYWIEIENLKYVKIS